jgi:hypothetical protein
MRMRILRTLFRPVACRIKRLTSRPKDYDLAKLAGLTSITEFSSVDVFIVGYPKSGNTWFQNLVAGLVYGTNPQYAPDSIIQELIPDVHYKRYYRRFQTPMFFKSHHLPRPEYKRVVYLLRDGRDALVSYYHYLSALRENEVDFMRLARDGEGVSEGKWHDHVEKWMANPYKASMISIKYEDLITNPIDQLRRFCEFVQLERENSFIEHVVTQARFDMMRQKEIVSGWDDGNRWPKDKFFVRRGIVGSYHDEMPKDVLDVFVHTARDTLSKCGYNS